MALSSHFNEFVLLRVADHTHTHTGHDRSHTHTHTQGTTDSCERERKREGGQSPTLFWPEQCQEWVSPYSPGAVARTIEPAPEGPAHPVSSMPDE
jgi:hypothetical protein